MKTLELQVGEDLFRERLIATLSTVFGLLAALLAAIGLYGVMAHTVSRRTQEIGVRMALGAGEHTVLWMVLRESLLLVLLGIALGLPLAYGLTRLIASMLFGVDANDVATMTAAGLLMAAVASLASFLPARRASKVDPMVALRYE